ncbi:TetR/AcrR family transcriptional regulator [Sphingopyxis yananensis]|uniref:TetR/AcrR family transcriptional regulator n=1 Tax=Sphingopyxis yananensis TaxID=2886687 RepID=UPI001D125603|nr:TetR/AcrR family transcriptional regulator [Sphingopyxis yananensis]MCC2601973.1 TetR/AcrR family transcriptional regulator [Sphingopyxis yananensis]
MARPSKPLISRKNAAEAALEVIDEHGLEELSLALVAKKLGVRPPSLYHHFKDKSELLQEVARIMLLKMPAASATDRSFEEEIIARCVATRQTLLQHPNAAPLILRYFPRHLLLAAYDRAAFEEPYPTPIQMTVIDAIEKYTYGAALFEASARSRGIPPMPRVDDGKYPSLAKAIADNPFNDEQLFVESLRLFLIGVRERVATDTIGCPLN